MTNLDGLSSGSVSHSCLEQELQASCFEDGSKVRAPFPQRAKKAFLNPEP